MRTNSIQELPSSLKNYLAKNIDFEKSNTKLETSSKNSKRKPTRGGIEVLPTDLNSLPKEGTRNNYFTKIAGKMRSQGKNTDQIYEFLSQTNNFSENPLPDHEIVSISKSVGGYPLSVDRIYSNQQDAADFMVSKLSDKFKNCIEFGWMFNENNIWKLDTKSIRIQNAIREQVISDCDIIHDMIPKVDDAGKKYLRSLITKLKSKGFQKCVLDMMGYHPAVVISQDMLDANSNIIGTQSGLYDLKLGKIVNDDDYFVTKSLNISINPDAICPLFLSFCERILPDKEKREFILKSIGYSFLGTNAEQKFFVWHGKGQTGKTTLAEVVGHIMGDYHASSQPRMFVRGKDDSASNDLARLKGVRFSTVSEFPMGAVMDSPKIKFLTGLDTITARFLFKEYFEFINKAVFSLLTNFLPVLDGGDDGMTRRINVITFDQKIPDNERDNNLPDKLKEEAQGIFNLFMTYAHKYMKEGLRAPECVESDTHRFCQQSNLIQQFFDDKFVYDASSTVCMTSLVYEAYKTWARERGYQPLSENLFSNAFVSLGGITKRRDTKGYVYDSIKYKPLSID